MTAGLTAALIVAAALGISFRTTRVVGIGATSILCFLWPFLAPLIVVVAAGTFLMRARKA